MRLKTNTTVWVCWGLFFLALSACGAQEPTAEERFAEIVTARAAEGGVSRADPGFMQYLEKQSMLGNSAPLAQRVSGSNFLWRRPAAAPRPEDLLGRADVWLHVNPQTLQTPGRSTALTHLSGPALWAAMNASGINGLYLAPTGAGGNLWDYDLERSLGVNGDTIQYSFAKSVGTEQDYARIIERAGAHRILLGGELVPAATGLGPDFLLAARNLRDYPGVYCLIEVPKTLWSLLPAAPRGEGELRVFPLDEAEVARLSAEGLFPPRLRQDAWAAYFKTGWAATSEVRGGDGNLRRWVYRYAHDPKRPILNFNDPSGTARRISGGSVLFQSAILGNYLNAVSLGPLIGLEPESDRIEAGSPADTALFGSLAAELSRQSRAYGSRTWLKDALPLPLAREVMLNGPDFVQDSVFSPAAEHALLTGDATLLNFMADEALRLGLDSRRLAHASTAHEGVDYSLPHLRYLAGQFDAGGAAGAARAKLAEELLRAVPAEALAAATPEDGENGARLFAEGRLHTSPAGLAALALGLRNNLDLTPPLESEIRRGHLLLQFFKAMQPGLWIISAQDLVGTMPVELRETADQRLADKRLAPMGSFALLASAEAGVYSSLGLPRAKSLYGSLDVQLYQPASFVHEIGRIVALRSSLGLARGALIGRLSASGPGLSALVTRLPAAGEGRDGPGRRYAVSIVNFSREARAESFDLGDLPELAGILDRAGIELLQGDLDFERQGDRLLVNAPGWSKGLVLITEDKAAKN